jgi:hypothetical protein
VGLGEDNLLEGDFENTPSVFGSNNSAYSKKTRMGSTDENGNRLSNMPGEERPSLDSVRPYDDGPSALVDKVEKLIEKSKLEKAKSKEKRMKETKGDKFSNALEKLKT